MKIETKFSLGDQVYTFRLVDNVEARESCPVCESTGKVKVGSVFAVECPNCNGRGYTPPVWKKRFAVKVFGPATVDGVTVERFAKSLEWLHNSTKYLLGLPYRGCPGSGEIPEKYVFETREEAEATAPKFLEAYLNSPQLQRESLPQCMRDTE